ncbi:MAG: hypothetical protein AAFP26_08320 [Planctomycetota bacterium]
MTTKTTGGRSGIGGGAPYDMSRTDPVCAASGQPIPEGDRCVAALVLGAGDAPLAKLIYSVEAWDALAPGERPGGLFAFWRTRAGASAQAGEAERMLRLEEVEDLFEQLEGVEDPERRALRYLLALVLSRKRVLVYEGGTPGEVVLFRRKVKAGEEGELYRVVDPGLSEERAAALGEQLAGVLGSELM